MDEESGKPMVSVTVRLTEAQRARLDEAVRQKKGEDRSAVVRALIDRLALPTDTGRPITARVKPTAKAARAREVAPRFKR